MGNTGDITMGLQDINPSCAVCFSGHRPERLPGSGDLLHKDAEQLTEELNKAITNAIKQGKIWFINGIMAGFDLMAATQVVCLKEKYPQIKLVTVAPFTAKYFSKETCWSREWIDRAKNIMELSDEKIRLSEQYHSGIYYERNRVMVDHSSELVCYWDGNSGGTQYTVDYAKSKGLLIHNLCNEG